MASDILTQLQTCYDQLLTQFFATVSYLSQRHPLVAPQPITGLHATLPAADEHSSKPGPEDKIEPFTLRPVSADHFAQKQRELAEDLVRKGQQIESLIQRLPGLGKDEEQQADDIRKLAEQVKAMEVLRKQKRQEIADCVSQLDHVILGMATSIDVPRTDG
ncbi:hypothetical protein DV736_g5809, partial [Chaetothyriales sp. CBS 134916]